MRAVWIVFWREVTVRLKNWRFWLGTLSFPLLIFLVVALPALVARFSHEKRLQVLVAGNLPLPQEEGPFRFVPVPQTAVDSLKNLLQTADDLVLLVLPPNPVESEICTLYTAFSLSSEKMQNLKAILTEVFRAYRQEALRVTSNDILKVLTPPPAPSLQSISRRGHALLSRPRDSSRDIHWDSAVYFAGGSRVSDSRKCTGRKEQSLGGIYAFSR